MQNKQILNLINKIDDIAADLESIAEQMEITFSSCSETILISNVLDQSIELTKIYNEICCIENI